MSRWFRHYAGMMRDDKLVRVALRSKQPIERVVWVFGAILESAAEIDDDGRYDFDAAEAAWFLRADENDLLAVESALRDAGHLADGAVVKWGDRQFKSDRSAERQSRYRQRRKEGAGDGEQTERSRERDDGVTSPSRHGDAPETETETETETEEPKGSVAPKRANAIFICPDGVNPQHWRDFMANRKRRNLATTQTAYEGIIRDIAALSSAEWPPGKLVELAARKGWGSIIIPDGGFQNGGSKGNGASQSGHGSTVDAAQRFLARHSAATG